MDSVSLSTTHGRYELYSTAVQYTQCEGLPRSILVEIQAMVWRQGDAG